MSYYAFDELLSSGPFAIIELFELQLFQELHNDNHRYYFHAGRNRKTTEPASGTDGIDSFSIKYRGQSYLPLPVEADGFEYKGDGSLPRPRIRIANLRGQITGLLLGINQITPGNDLNGAQVTRIRTLSRFLDSDNWENGVNPYGNPDESINAQLPQEIYYVDRKVTENRDFVEFELVSSLDLANLKTPRRLAMQNLCQWEYKSKECGYSGSDEFTVDGTALTSQAANSFTFVAGANVLNANNSLNSASGDELVSSNGWYKLTVDNNGNINLIGKDNETKWSTTRGPGPNTNGYELRLNGDGNLVIYNKDYSREDTSNSVVWVSNTFRLGNLIGLNRLTIDGVNQWWPDDVQKGRSAGFTWELVGSSPTAAGETRSITKTFTDTDKVLGTSRSVNITFNLTSVGLGADRYFSNNSGYTGYSWNQIDSITINSSTGLWRHDYDYVAKLTLSSNNPFRANHPTEGTLTEAGAYYKIQSDNWHLMRLVLNDTGLLRIERTDGSFNTWSAGYAGSSTEPQVTPDATAISVSGQCGKRVSDCRLRFPNGDASGGLPFGSFPALGNNF